MILWISRKCLFENFVNFISKNANNAELLTCIFIPLQVIVKGGCQDKEEKARNTVTFPVEKVTVKKQPFCSYYLNSV